MVSVSYQKILLLGSRISSSYFKGPYLIFNALILFYKILNLSLNILVSCLVLILSLSSSAFADLITISNSDKTFANFKTTQVLPDKLSQLDLFIDLPNLIPNPGVMPYQVNFPLWSDGATKNRWIFIPFGSKIQFDSTEAWLPAVGTVLIKEFDFDRRVETRIEFLSPTGWQFASYLWQDDQKEAIRVDQATSVNVSSPASPAVFKWVIPAPWDCVKCHRSTGTQLGSPALGLNTAQFGSFRISKWILMGLFSNPPERVDQLSYLPDIGQPTITASAHDLARGYLAVNCSSCHRPGGFVPTNLDFRWSTLSSHMNAINKPPLFGNLGIPGSMIITPMDKFKSLLWLRMGRTDSARMPYLGSKLQDQSGLNWLGQWIDNGSP